MPTSSDSCFPGGPPHRSGATLPGPDAPADGPAPAQRERPRPALQLDNVAGRYGGAPSVSGALADARARAAGKLSGGERKMLAMAGVLMLEPAVLVLDEPTSNLSAELSRAVLRDQVRRLADAGTAVLLVEQKAFEALSVSDWAYILVGGRIEIAGPASEILGRPDIREVFLGRSAQDSPYPAETPDLST